MPRTDPDRVNPWVLVAIAVGLQKCGFKIIGKNKDFANGRGEDTEEYILRLDLDQANE